MKSTSTLPYIIFPVVGTMLGMAFFFAGIALLDRHAREAESAQHVRPLGSPTTNELTNLETVTTLEYRVPTVETWDCPRHGKVVDPFVINGEPYCRDCVLERILDNINDGVVYETEEK